MVTGQTGGDLRQPHVPMLWQVFGWTFDTTITVSPLMLAGISDRHPRLKLIAHHGGGLIPHFSGRVEMMPLFTGLDRTLSEALELLAGALW